MLFSAPPLVKGAVTPRVCPPEEVSGGHRPINHKLEEAETEEGQVGDTEHTEPEDMWDNEHLTRGQSLGHDS